MGEDPDAGNRTVPTGSMWLIGLSEIRPNMRAVGSPRRLAIQAWADSWTVIAKRNAINWNRWCRCCRLMRDWL